MKPSEILIAAKAKIATPQQWTQGGYAKDVNGKAVSEESDKAVCFCLMGAIYAVTAAAGKPTLHAEDRTKAFDFLDEAIGGDTWIVPYNDAEGRKHEEVMQVMDKAIQKAQDENL